MILDRILQTKAAEVAAAQVVRPLAEVVRAAEAAPAPRGFRRALAAGAETAPVRVIAEVKKASPSKGVIRPDFDPVAIARSYEAGGAACLSVLTDEPFFQGSLDDLRAVRAAVGLPILRKDFLIDPYQVYEARAAGADAILLIVAAFAGESAGGRAPADMARLLTLARELGMDALVEVHTEAELAVALEAGADLIGINNRDLRTFETTLAVTERLAPRIPADRLVVSESGIGSQADLIRVARAGARAVLVGESLMRAPDPGAALRQLLGKTAG
jgi:indole-3-glycerol phosphate synthase